MGELSRAPQPRRRQLVGPTRDDGAVPLTLVTGPANAEKARQPAYDVIVRADTSMGNEGLPGAELVLEGIEDLLAGRDTALAALVTMAAPRLRAVGVDVPRRAAGERPSHHLYALLAEHEPAGAHSRYNALVGRIVGFARAAERARAR